MSQGVNVTEAEIVFFTEFFEPEIRCVVVHRSAIPLYEQVIAKCKEAGFEVETGQFGADMSVYSVNDGPVTIILES